MMEVNIWSDVRCPFCYIGKRKFEKALEKFPQKDKVHINWKSFELDPYLETQLDITAADHFADRKGIAPEEVAHMFDHVTQVATETGLRFHLDKSVVANSFNAHRLIQFAKTKGLGNEMEEQLFKIYFTEGRNIDDKQTLLETGVIIGLDEKEVNAILFSDGFAAEVKSDEFAAQQIGVSGVPFFVFNDKYAVSGAQSPETFLEILNKSWEDFEKEKTLINIDGESCTTDGSCSS